MIDRTELAKLLLIDCSAFNGRVRPLRVLMGHKMQI